MVVLKQLLIEILLGENLGKVFVGGQNKMLFIETPKKQLDSIQSMY